MPFFPDVVVAIILSLGHLLLSFNLQFTDKYRGRFRMYSVIVNLLFIGLLGAFYLFISGSPLSDQGVGMYFNSLAAFYFMLFVPLAIALALRLRTVIMNADIYSLVLKYVLIVGLVTGIIGVVWVGYPFFIFFFYGFAP